MRAASLLAALAPAVALAACAPSQPQAPPLPLVRADLAPGQAVAAQGETRFAVRALRDGQSVPAACQAEGQGFGAGFTAPAQLAVPAFGAASAPIRIVCKAEGRSGTRTAHPGLRQTGGAAGVYPTVGIGVSTGGDVGVSLGGWWGGFGAQRTQVYAVRYPDLAIDLD